MEFTLDGVGYRIDASEVRTALRGGTPEDVREHWVEVDGVRWPPKQALALATGIQRGDFTSHIALRQFQRLGFATSAWRGSNAALTETAGRGSWDARQREGMPTTSPHPGIAACDPSAADAFGTLVDFLSTDLTARIRHTENALRGVDRHSAQDVVDQSGLTGDLLAAVLLVRQVAGRLNDVVHAATIVQLLPSLLEPGERVLVRPSLAAGNDPSRPFDLETTHRVAEFKLAFWKGADAMRMRGVFADLVHLAMDSSGRRAQLFVVGQRPIRFLRTGTATAEWALGRSSPRLRSKFTECYGSSRISIRDFTVGPGSHVELVDLAELMPVLNADMSSSE